LQVRQQDRADFKFPLLFDLHSVASAWKKKVDAAEYEYRPCATVVLSSLPLPVFLFPSPTFPPDKLIATALL